MTDPRLIGTLGQPFPEQVAAFRLRLGNLVPTARWDDIRHNAHDTGFMVAGATKADLLADLAAAVDKAVSKGTSLDEFRRDFRRIVAERGWTGWTGEGSKDGEAWRTRVIYQTNMRVSFASARRAQLIEAGYAFWIYKHGGSRDPRPEHLAMNGITLSPDHEFWTIWSPPNGWGCSCYVVGARSERGAQRLGGDPDKALPEWWSRLDPRTGAPHGIDKGWDYAPGATVSDRVRIIDGKLPQLPPRIGAAMMAALPAATRKERLAEFHAFFDEALVAAAQKRASKKVSMIVGALSPKMVTAMDGHGFVPKSADISLSQYTVHHVLREAKISPIAVSWWRDFPAHLETAPYQAFLDTRETPPALLLVYEVPPEFGRVAIKVDFYQTGRGVLNAIRSGRMLDEAQLRTDQGIKALKKLEV